MRPGLQKILAAVQIVLQLCPPSFLLYVMQTNTVSAQDNIAPNITQSPKDANSTEKSVAQIAVQAGTALGADDASSSAANALVSTATGTASAEVQQWLSQFGTARVSISTDERFTLNDSELDLLVPLYNQKENLLFTQLGGRRNDDRNIINTGLGYRHFSDNWMWGTNVFYDRQISGNQHERLGVGAELGWDYIKLSANGYFRLSDWMSSSRYQDYDERVANGFDIRATGYLPAYPQLGANVIYEQYYGDSVGLFGDDEDDRQKNPHAVTLGLNYTPVPLVTFGVNQKFGKGGENDTQLNLAVSWTPGVPMSVQLDPSSVAARRSLMGGRQDLVDRNNNIVLEYRKQELITLSLPPMIEGDELSKQSVTAKVKTKHGLDHIEWQAASFLSNGGKISAGKSPDQWVFTLPSWQSSGINSYTLTGTAWDKNGNASNTSEMKVNVTGMDVNSLQSSTTVSPTKIAADGVSTATVTVTLKTSNAESATGLASRMSATLTSSVSPSANASSTVDVKKPTIASFSETSPGIYTATLTSGTTSDTLTIQPFIDGSVKLASAKLIEEATVTLPQLTTLDVSATSAVAGGSTPITLTAHVADQNGNPLKDAVLNWASDNEQAQLSQTQSSTDEKGVAQIQVSSTQVISTVVTAQLAEGNSLSTPTLSFTVDASTAKVASVESDKLQIVANNIDTGTVTAKVVDNYDHPLNGITVNWSVENSDVVKVGEKTSVTNSQGIATLPLKSAKTGAVTVTASVNGTSPQKTDTINFVADSSTQKVTSITLSKNSALANGSDSITYEATVTDASGNVIKNAAVSWSADNTDAVLSATQTTSDADGKAKIQVSSRKVGDVVISAQTSASTAYQAEKATFTADTSTATILTLDSDRDSALANGADGIVLSTTIVDANGNRLSGVDVNWSSSPATGALSASSTKTDSSGVAKVTLTSKEVVVYSVSADVNGTTKTSSPLTFIADSNSAHLDTLKSSTNSALADGSTAITLTATVLDSSGHPVKGEQINWRAENSKAQLSATQSTTDEQGQTQIQVTSAEVISTVITAQHNQAEALQSDTLNFIADTASASVYSVKPEKTQVVANNIDTSTIEAQVVDSFNHPLNGITVNWKVNKTDGTSAATATSVTDSQGTATFVVKSAKAGVVTVSADVNGSNAKQTGEITFVADSSTQSVSQVQPDKNQATANGTDAIIYEATVTDAKGNPVSGVAVNWSADSTDATLSVKQTTSDASGKSQISVTSLKAATVIVTAQTNDTTAKQADGVKFVADIASAKIANVTSDKQSALANGSDAIMVKATVTDANGNALDGADVAWAATPTGANLSAASAKTGSDGVAQVQLTSTSVGKYSVAATINGSSESASDLSFTADSSTAELTLLEADKESGIVADKDNVTLTATVVDENKHPVSGVTVNWTSSETNSTFTASSSVTDVNGQATTLFSSLKAGDIMVTAALGTHTQTKTLKVIGNVDTATIVSVTPDKSKEVADGTASIAWTAKVTDANDNALNGVTVNWSADNSQVVLSPASTTSGESGEATTHATSVKSGQVTMTAAITTPAVQRAASVVSFVGDAKTARISKLIANTDHVAANTTPVTYTATVLDVNDNLVEGATVAWTTTMNKLSAQTSNTNASGEATVKLSGAEFGKPTVTATINNSTLSDATVMFMGTIDDTWTIANGAQASSYKGETISNLNYLGFIVTGNTTGPTQLVWNTNYGAYSVLTAPLVDENGVTHTVTFRGQVSNQCTLFEFNNASGCQYPGNAPKITYDPSWGDNAKLPAGKYTGEITFNGKDWHSSWALSYTVHTTLNIN